MSDLRLPNDLCERLVRLQPTLRADSRVLAVFVFGSQVDGYATFRAFIADVWAIVGHDPGADR